MISIHGAGPHQMAIVREHVEGWAARAHDRMDPDEIMAGIANRDRQAWVVEDETGEVLAVFLTRLEPPNAFLDACSGRDRHRWATAVDETVEAWARSQGAKRIICDCRPGWKRTAQKLGWREAHVEMVKELS